MLRKPPLLFIQVNSDHDKIMNGMFHETFVSFIMHTCSKILICFVRKELLRQLVM